jgi:hypothetical protein
MITKTKQRDVDDINSSLDEILSDKQLYARKKRVRRTKEELKPNYVDPIEMERLIKSYYVTGELYSELADMIQKIGTRLGYAQNFINYCVDEQTEALTMRGWLKHNEINEGDIILSYNIQTRALAWSKVKGIYRAPYEGLMHHLKCEGLDALVTPGHKFVTSEDGLKTVENIKCTDYVVLNGLPVEDNTAVHSDEFVADLAPCRVMLTHEFVLSLTQSQRIKLIHTMAKSDEQNTSWSYNNEDKDLVDSFLMLCTLAGLTTSTELVQNVSELSSNNYYVVNIYNTQKTHCLGECIDFHGGSPGPEEDNKSNPTVHYSGTVWCPETEYGTWVCRRGSAIYTTGNSYKEEMIGDAIIKMMTALTRHRFKCDLGFNPFSYFTKVAYRAFQNRIKKEKKEHDTIHRYQEEVYELLTESGQIPHQKNTHAEDDGSDHYNEELSTVYRDE